jgi:hypothetical protein
MGGLDYLLFNGIGGIPYATFGMVGLVIGVFVYATVSDVVTEATDEIQNTANSMQYNNTLQNISSSVSSGVSSIGENISSVFSIEKKEGGIKKKHIHQNEPGENYKVKMGGSKKIKHRAHNRKTLRK